MAQNKTGLHKKISSIFDGVPVPKETDAQQPSSPPAADYKGHLPPRPPIGGVRMRAPVRIPQSLSPKSSRSDIFPRSLKQGFPGDIVEKLSALKWGQFVDKQKIKVLIIPILSIMLILVLYRNFAGSTRSVPRGHGVQKVQNEPDTAGSASVIVWQKPDVYPVYMRDPTQLSAAASYIAGAGSIAVRGIVYSEDRPSVVIGSEIKHVGDTIGEVTITKINRDGVEFSMQGKTWTQRVQ